VWAAHPGLGGCPKRLPGGHVADRPPPRQVMQRVLLKLADTRYRPGPGANGHPDGRPDDPTAPAAIRPDRKCTHPDLRQSVAPRTSPTVRFRLVIERSSVRIRPRALFVQVRDLSGDRVACLGPNWSSLHGSRPLCWMTSKEPLAGESDSWGSSAGCHGCVSKTGTKRSRPLRTRAGVAKVPSGLENLGFHPCLIDARTAWPGEVGPPFEWRAQGRRRCGWSTADSVWTRRCARARPCSHVGRALVGSGHPGDHAGSAWKVEFDRNDDVKGYCWPSWRPAG
jgi:hypothetical protein